MDARTYTITVDRGWGQVSTLTCAGGARMALDYYGDVLRKADDAGEPLVLVLTDPDGNEITRDII